MTPHIILVSQSGSLLCQHCCQLEPPPRDMPVKEWIDYCKGFELMHKHCQKPEEPSKQVELFDELAKKERPEDECHGKMLSREVDMIRQWICPRCDDRRLLERAGIDGMSDDPDPETDPPERDADGAPLPPPAYSHLVPDEATRLKFLQHYPWPKDSFQLRADLAIVLQRIEGAELPSAATVNGWHPDTIQFQKAAGWVRDELADMNRGEHPEFDPFLPLERQPMPAELAALCLPVKKAKRGARPLTSGRKRRSGSTQHSS